MNSLPQDGPAWLTNPQSKIAHLRITPRAAAAQLFATGPAETGKGGKPGNAPTADAASVTNAEFVARLFGSLDTGASAVVCSKAGDPLSGGWATMAATDVDEQCPADRNNYVSCSSLYPDADGNFRARKEQFAAFHFLMLDDVGIKVNRGLLDGFTPTYEIETSPGNSQVGIRLRTPITDAGQAQALQKAVIAAGLCDAGAGNVVRWCRLPVAINGKSKYEGKDGAPFTCRLTTWNPDVCYEAEELAEKLGLKVAASIARTTVAIGIGRIAARDMERGDEVYTPAAAASSFVNACSLVGTIATSPVLGSVAIETMMLPAW